MFFGAFFLMFCGEREEVRFLREIKNKTKEKGVLRLPLGHDHEMIYKIANKNFPDLILEVIPDAKNIYVIARENHTIIRYSSSS